MAYKTYVRACNDCLHTLNCRLAIGVFAWQVVVQPSIICPPPPMDSDPSALFFATLFMCLEPPISGKAVVPMKSLGRTPWSARLPGFCWRFSATGRLKGRSTAFALPLENIDGGASRWTTGLFRLLAWGGDPREARACRPSANSRPTGARRYGRSAYGPLLCGS